MRGTYISEKPEQVINRRRLTRMKAKRKAFIKWLIDSISSSFSLAGKSHRWYMIGWWCSCHEGFCFTFLRFARSIIELLLWSIVLRLLRVYYLFIITCLNVLVVGWLIFYTPYTFLTSSRYTAATYLPTSYTMMLYILPIVTVCFFQVVSRKEEEEKVPFKKHSKSVDRSVWLLLSKTASIDRIHPFSNFKRVWFDFCCYHCTSSILCPPSLTAALAMRERQLESATCEMAKLKEYIDR